MKPAFEQVSPSGASSFRFLQLQLPTLKGPFHYHPELELIHIITSRGIRYVGGHFASYEAGDLVLIGSNVPHTWLSEPSGFMEDARALVIQFPVQLGGEAFWNLPEMKQMGGFLTGLRSAVTIHGDDRALIIEMMQKLSPDYRSNRLLLLFEILQLISVSANCVVLDSNFLNFSPSPAERERFQKVFDFLICNFQRSISLLEVANVAHLSPTAFCRYFRKVTHRSLTEVIADMRIKRARELLQTTNRPVTDVCFESGFGNLSHFNKVFKAATGFTPLAFRLGSAR